MTDAPLTPSDDVDPLKSRPHLLPARDVIAGGLSKKTDLISYLFSGIAIGLLLDWALGTRPMMLIGWTLAAFFVGAYQLWKASAVLEEEGKARSHGV